MPCHYLVIITINTKGSVMNDGVVTNVGDGRGVEQSVGPQLTGLAAAESLHAVGQLVLQLGQHVDGDVLPTREEKTFTLSRHFAQSDLQPFIHTFKHRWQSQPCKATARSSGTVTVRLKDSSTLN